ncbi:hypothetical protein EDEG_03027 [Edhazardia aedis USNM 41457]|uniref:Large ribosomal subunit protein eL24-related N-terminal domain-containing protein n=1 Tax=Edhazardia aedis (strain USNM 41457) TaxID=1003232 RepID=J9D4V7_EDHAE|nr:hypothetical protein EDEG_03027 [Edhazardia aedis USNM 41457]|eukprot:EJW02559.1 hypothetical protein EDEG_03027 [Edhazardia aedis USNM 41457]
MKEGNCAYSGLPIPKGSGTILVKSDSKALLFANTKVRNFVDQKIKPRYIRWTQNARALLKKENVVKEQKITVPRVVKIVRGFPSVCPNLLKERQERAAKEQKEKELQREKEKEREREREKAKEKEKNKAMARGPKLSKSQMRKK